VMEGLHEPAEQILSNLVDCFNAYRCDERFLTMLAYWVNLDALYPRREADEQGIDWRARAAPLPEGRLRELIAMAPLFAQLRGTARGMKLFLEVAIGLPFAIEETVAAERGKTIPFHIRVVAPPEAQPQRDLITRIIELEKPAYVTFELSFGDPSAPAAARA
jgi:Phage tail protein (Tail_P2_I)